MSLHKTIAYVNYFSCRFTSFQVFLWNKLSYVCGKILEILIRRSVIRFCRLCDFLLQRGGGGGEVGN